MRQMMALCAIFVLLWLSTVPEAVWAQNSDSTVAIEGVVRGCSRPLFLANVIVLGTSKGAQTDRNGHFVIKNVPVGPQRLRMLYMGLDPADTTIEIRPGDNPPFALRMMSARFYSSSVLKRGI